MSSGEHQESRIGDRSEEAAWGAPPAARDGWGILGPEGPFSRFFPFPLESVQSVLDRYEVVGGELDRWPIQPESGTLQDEEGTHYYSSVKDPSSDEDWIHPSELKMDSSGKTDR